MVLGVDVGGTKVAVAAVDGVTATHALENPTPDRARTRCSTGSRPRVREVIEHAGQPAAIGVGVPSQIDYETGTVESSVNIPLTGVPPARGARPPLRRAGVRGQRRQLRGARRGAHRGPAPPRDAHARHGVGGGVVIDGLTFRGAHGLGAELGHMTINPDGPPCPGNCPNRGCLEAYCSGQALERDATQLANDKPDSRLAGPLGADAKVSGRELVAAADAGRSRTRCCWWRTSRACSVWAIATCVNIFEPERLAIGGGLSRASHLFLDRAVAGGCRTRPPGALAARDNRARRGRRRRRRDRCRGARGTRGSAGTGILRRRTSPQPRESNDDQHATRSRSSPSTPSARSRWTRWRRPSRVIRARRWRSRRWRTRSTRG